MPKKPPGRQVKVWLYPNAQLDAALERAAAGRRVVCGGQLTATKQHDMRGHLAYGEPHHGYDGFRDGSSFAKLPFYGTGKNCELMALIVALRDPNSPYRASSGEEADIFVYFPHPYVEGLLPEGGYTEADRAFLAQAPKPDDTHIAGRDRLRVRKYCEFLWSLDVPTARRLMPLLSRHNFRRHFVLAGDGLGWPGPCAHEGLVSPPLRTAWASPPPFLARLLVHVQEPENVDASRGSMVHVPYVGPIHERVDPFAHERTYLMSYVGSTNGTPQNALLRTLLKRACEAAGDERTCKAARPTKNHQNLRFKWESTFCLEPGGWGLMRRSVVDTLQMGCLPVFFMARQHFQHLWPWHWRDWREHAVINIDVFSQEPLPQIVFPPDLVRSLVPAGDATVLKAALAGGKQHDSQGQKGEPMSAKWVIDLLQAIPKEKVAAMQRALAANVHAVVYGKGHLAGDAIDRTFRALHSIGRERERLDVVRHSSDPHFLTWPDVSDDDWLTKLTGSPDKDKVQLLREVDEAGEVVTFFCCYAKGFKGTNRGGGDCTCQRDCEAAQRRRDPQDGTDTVCGFDHA